VDDTRRYSTLNYSVTAFLGSLIIAVWIVASTDENVGVWRYLKE
jgi:hypothetical protein